MVGKVLSAEWVSTDRIATRSMLKNGRYEALQTPSVHEALDLARSEAPHLIMLDHRGPGRTLLASLKDDVATKDIPVLAVASDQDPEARLRALDAGASDVITRPIDEELLLSKIRATVRRRETAVALAEREATVRDLGFAEPRTLFQPQGRVALIARSLDVARSWREAIQPLAQFHVDVLSDEDLDRSFAGTADVFVVEAFGAAKSFGLTMLSELRSRERTRHADIIVVYDETDPTTAARALDAGANGVIEMGFSPDELIWHLDDHVRAKQKGDQLRATVEEGLKLAVTDPLTGLFNRRYAIAHAQRLVDEALPGRTLGVVMADIDRFKSLNDEWGHTAGDAVLMELADRLRENVRGMDTVARVGGEEFLILLPDAQPDAVKTAASRLCAIIRETPFPLPGARPEISVTISLGVALLQPGEEIGSLIDRADKALYKAKSAGRDTVNVSEQLLRSA
jgi:two-component system cell cycle response regulator